MKNGRMGAKASALSENKKRREVRGTHDARLICQHVRFVPQKEKNILRSTSKYIVRSITRDVRGTKNIPVSEYILRSTVPGIIQPPDAGRINESVQYHQINSKGCAANNSPGYKPGSPGVTGDRRKEQTWEEAKYPKSHPGSWGGFAGS